MAIPLDSPDGWKVWMGDNGWHYAQRIDATLPAVALRMGAKPYVAAHRESELRALLAIQALVDDQWRAEEKARKAPGGPERPGAA